MKGTLSIFVICVFITCTTGKKNFVAKPIKKDSKINLIRLNGSYVGKQINGSNTSVGCFFLYENGVALLYDPVYYIHEINNSDVVRKQILYTINFKDSFSRKKESGGFVITENRINIQVFRPTTGGLFGLCEYKGSIINDSTIYIGSCNFPENPNFCRENFYLHFIPMTKPDSSNQLMKKKWYWSD